jgi:hypothetical protein
VGVHYPSIGLQHKADDRASGEPLLPGNARVGATARDRLAQLGEVRRFQRRYAGSARTTPPDAGCRLLRLGRPGRLDLLRPALDRLGLPMWRHFVSHGPLWFWLGLWLGRVLRWFWRRRLRLDDWRRLREGRRRRRLLLWGGRPRVVRPQAPFRRLGPLVLDPPSADLRTWREPAPGAFPRWPMPAGHRSATPIPQQEASGGPATRSQTRLPSGSGAGSCWLRGLGGSLQKTQVACHWSGGRPRLDRPVETLSPVSGIELPAPAEAE